MRIFLDGVEQTKSFDGNTFPTAIANGGSQMRIGSGGPLGAFWFMNGALSAVRITKNRTFTEPELLAHVASMVNGGRPKFHDQLTSAEKVGLVTSLDLTGEPPYLDRAAAPHTFSQNGGGPVSCFIDPEHTDGGSVQLVHRAPAWWLAPRWLATGGPGGTPCWEFLDAVGSSGMGWVADFPAADVWPKPASTDEKVSGTVY